MIQKSKKQIWLVYEKEYTHEDDPKTVVFVTTNFQKVKNFLTSKIKKLHRKIINRKYITISFKSS